MGINPVGRVEPQKHQTASPHHSESVVIMPTTRSIKHLLMFGAAVGAIAVAPALGASTSSPELNAHTPCPPGETFNPYAVACRPNVELGPGAFSQLALSQPGSGYNGPGVPPLANAPSQRLLTVCNGGAQSNCKVQAFYGFRSVPAVWSRVGYPD